MLKSINKINFNSSEVLTSTAVSNGNAITNANNIGNLNPFRYRGYYYDTESGFYYLMSRYYDPVTHRFINADGYFQSGGGILDANMHAYCGNNPIMYSDPSGCCYIIQKTSAGTYIGTSWVIQTAVPGVPGFCNDCKSYNPTSTSNNNTKIVSANVWVGTVQQESSGYPLGWYTKAGDYYIENYQPSYLNAYSFYNCNDLTQSEVGINILSISAFVGLDNLGIQLGIPIDDDTYSLEATISLRDGCARIGWDSTQYASNGVFLAGGGGLEVNMASAALIGFSIYSYMNGSPIEFNNFQNQSTYWNYAY